MSVHTTNQISEHAIRALIQTGAMAWAASALESPIGPVGGAIFGFVQYFTSLGLKEATTRLLHVNDPQVSAAAKTLAKAITFFGSHAAVWGVLAYAGLPLAIGHMISLSLTSVVTTLGIVLLAECLFGPTTNRRSEPAGSV